MTILDVIGNTPLVTICDQKLMQDGISIKAKLEGCNPGGSVKDRAALFMIESAEKSGVLHKGVKIIEATSGNTGIAIAMISAVKGYKAVLCMPECVSVERRHILEAMGAEIVLTQGHMKTDGAIEMVKSMIEKNPEMYCNLDQFNNIANTNAHYETTGPEIWEQTSGMIDYLVCGIGTSGTLVGCAKFLKERNPDIIVCGVQPELNHGIQGLKNLSESTVPSIFSNDLIDKMVYVNDEEAFDATRELADKHGVFVGMSSGAALAGIRKLNIKNGSNVVTVFPDRGDRYLSTNLFRSYCAKCPP